MEESEEKEEDDEGKVGLAVGLEDFRGILSIWSGILGYMGFMDGLGSEEESEDGAEKGNEEGKFCNK